MYKPVFDFGGYTGGILPGWN